MSEQRSVSPPPSRIGPTEPDDAMVICPVCTSQFRAIPLDVQRQLAFLSAPKGSEAAALVDEIERLRAENERLHEQLRLATVDQATAEAEANDARAEIEALMDRTTRLTPNDAGYVVAHANEDGAHVDTAITLTERLDLALEERGHEMVLAERARESHR